MTGRLDRSPATRRDASQRRNAKRPSTPRRFVAPMFTAEDIIDCYSRAEAIADGELVDVSETAREAGVKYPTALTRAAFETYVAWTADDEREGVIQDEAGRLWDVLWMFACAARRRPLDDDSRRVTYSLFVVPRSGSGTAPEFVELVAVVGPGDTAEPVITIMLEGED